MGEIAKTATVSTNDPQNAQFILQLRAHFKGAASPNPTGPPPAYAPDTGKRLGSFSIAPTDRWTTSTIKGQASTGTLYLYNHEAKPIHIKQMSVGGTDFTATLLPIEDGKRYQVNVSTNPALKPGQYHQTLKFVTDAKENNEFNVELEATIYAPIFATPTSILLPAITADSDLSTLTLPSIYVRKIREGGLQIKSVHSSLPFLKLNVSAQVEGQVYKIDLSLDKNHIQKGPFKGNVRIETNDPDFPVMEVAVHGTFN